MAAQDRINQLQAYIDFYKTNGLGPNRSRYWNGAPDTGATDMTGFDNKQAAAWAQSQALADDDSVSKNKFSEAATQQMPDFYSKGGNSFNIPAYQAPQYRQSSPMPQYQGGSGVQNMLLELLRSRQPQNTFRQG